MMKPESEPELAEMVAAAKRPLRIVGGGTRGIGRPVDGELLSTVGLKGVTLYEPGALTLVAGAGTPLDEIESTLTKEGQRLAFEPMDHRILLGTTGTPTIGGVVAANVSGPRRIQVGACRDSALGVRFVDGSGQVLKNGGRVMKNVTGYDLVKLMAGSWGTLGVLSEVSLKVQAIPEAEATLVGRGLTVRESIAALSAALGSPFDVSGAALLTEGGEACVRVEGLAASVAYRVKRMRSDMCAGWDVIEGQKSAQLWRDIRDVRSLAGSEDAIWRLSVKPTDASEILKELGDPNAVCDWGGGLIWLAMSAGGDGGAARVRSAVARLGGHATLVRGSDALRRDLDVFQPEVAPLAALSKGLRARFDPRGILNPGLMG